MTLTQACQDEHSAVQSPEECLQSLYLLLTHKQRELVFRPFAQGNARKTIKATHDLGKNTPSFLYSES